MKKILITGKNSYVGNSFEKWVTQWTEEYEIDKISIRNEDWKNHDFGKYDVVLHVAGIAHQDTKADQEDLYYRVNRDLTIEIAEKAKDDGVKQFIFLSSMIVYGTSSKVGELKVINKDTIPRPVNFYGKSKLEAEKGISVLQNSNFKVVILRPPMIYGKNSKGNYPILSKFAKISPVFPDIDNKRSMLYIDNLTEFIRLLINNEDRGTFFPQNNEFVSTKEMVNLIANNYGNNLTLTKIFNPIFKIGSKKINIFNKIFGDLIYDRELSTYKEVYALQGLEESINNTEQNKK